MDVEPEDVELFERWAAGDAAAGELLLARYYGAVARFFSSKVTHEPEELLQRTFLRCVEQRAAYRREAAFRSYLFSIARNVLFEHFRDRKRRGEREADVGVSSAHALDPTPSQLLGERRETGLVLEALRRVPLDHQIVLELFYWEGLSTKELADVLEAPQGTIKGRLSRARRELALVRDALAAEWGCVTQPLDADLARLGARALDPG